MNHIETLKEMRKFAQPLSDTYLEVTGKEFDLSAALTASIADMERMEWLEANPYMAYRDRDCESRMLCDHHTLVDEDRGHRHGRRGIVSPTIREAINAAMKGDA